jgi:hypothetical protein
MMKNEDEIYGNQRMVCCGKKEKSMDLASTRRRERGS